jgi:succinyl-CoA synthetase beta subunit
MRILEHEAKNILSSYDITVPNGYLFESHDENAACRFTPCILKAQVPAGKRNQFGGIKTVRNPATFSTAVNSVMSANIDGHTPRTVLVEELLDIQREFYLSLTINIQKAGIELLVHREGGIDIEDQSLSDFLRLPLQHESCTQAAAQVAEYLRLEDQEFTIGELLGNLLRCFIESDATTLEINPLVLTADQRLIAADCKMEVDDAAKFRHPEWAQLSESITSHNFVTLDEHGTVATIANGAGLAMATVDGVKAAGFIPANFLDIGGGANQAAVMESFQKIMTYPNISAIVINIFAGITHCDEVAKAIIAASEEITDLPKLYIRLEGTNITEATQLLSAKRITRYQSLPDALMALEKGVR